MKMKQCWRKSLALLLALAICLGLVPAAHVHAAGETDSEEAAGEASASFEPWGHGYRFVDILNFDPASDPYSQELVASVPLQERNATFAATQANPDLSDDSKLYVISSGNYRSTDVNEAPWNAGMSYDEFSYNLFKFWQYADMVGAGGRPTQNIAIGSSEKEYGIIAIPMAAATNAAHKTGDDAHEHAHVQRRGTQHRGEVAVDGDFLPEQGVGHGVGVCQHGAGNTDDVAGDHVDERKGQHRRKGTACAFFCPAAADGYGEQDMQVVDDGPADVLHRSADGHDGGNVTTDHLRLLAQTDHQTRRRYDSDDGHQNFAQFLQKVEIDEPLLLGSCLCGCHDVPPCSFAFDYASIALRLHWIAQ